MLNKKKYNWLQTLANLAHTQTRRSFDNSSCRRRYVTTITSWIYDYAP